jgi:hypothetical protein
LGSSPFAPISPKVTLPKHKLNKHTYTYHTNTHPITTQHTSTYNIHHPTPEEPRRRLQKKVTWARGKERKERWERGERGEGGKEGGGGGEEKIDGCSLGSIVLISKEHSLGYHD